jgi:pyruvate dehydrogenase E2 component (dihydrolipoamide acetyltransferase)
MAIKEIILPKLGQTMETGTIIEWLKQEGDPVGRGEVLFTVESDKATLEVESPGKGFLRKILVPAGEEKPVLMVVGLITKTLDEDISAYADLMPRRNQAFSEKPGFWRQPGRTTPTNIVSSGRRIFSSPRARKLAREKDVDLALVTGTGPGGRIAERDVAAYLASRPQATPVARRLAEQAGVDLRTVTSTGAGGRITKADVDRALAEARAPEVELQVAEPETLTPKTVTPLSGVRAVIARRMVEGHSTTAPVTLTTEVDATEFVALREQLKAHFAHELGFNIGYNDLLIKLVAHALREFPYMNARLVEETIQEQALVHVALAVDTDRGLLVPIVRDADRKGLTEVAQELRAVIERARAGSALPDELSGSTFTITNLGMHEIDAFTPIINLPEAAILGVGRIKERPAVVDGALCVRKTMWLSLTFDHRLVDGAPAARFLQTIKHLIEDPFLWLAATM